MLAFERLAEEKIREAIAAGAFDRLPGKGKPLAGDEPMSLRPEDRLAYLILKNSGFLPEFLHWRKELETCTRELEDCHHHCRERLEKILAHGRALQNARAANLNEKTPLKLLARLRALFLPRKKREQSSSLGRGKEVSANGSITRQIRTLRQTYSDERRWLRQRLSELADRADAAAQQLQQALVEKEIRDRRPVTTLLGRPYVSSAEILSQFDREFPLAPWKGSQNELQLDPAGALAA
jgi:hypothetical protein